MNTHYGIYGGQYVPETLTGALRELAQTYLEAKDDPAFRAELDDLLKHYVGRESPLYYAKRLSEHLGGSRIYLKREDLNHTGAHKINNTMGQALLARRMGKKRLIAETGAGMHGVATATVAALFGMECEIFMGSVDVARQSPNVDRMHALGAKVRSITEGGATLKDAMNAALREWASCSDTTFYLIGTAAGPYPYPMLVKDFQSVCRTKSSPVSAAVPTPSACSRDSKTRRKSVVSASKRAAWASPQGSTPPPSTAAKSASCTA